MSIWTTLEMISTSCLWRQTKNVTDEANGELQSACAPHCSQQQTQQNINTSTDESCESRGYV